MLFEFLYSKNSYNSQECYPVPQENLGKLGIEDTLDVAIYLSIGPLRLKQRAIVCPCFLSHHYCLGCHFVSCVVEFFRFCSVT